MKFIAITLAIVVLALAAVQADPAVPNAPTFGQRMLEKIFHGAGH